MSWKIEVFVLGIGEKFRWIDNEQQNCQRTRRFACGACAPAARPPSFVQQHVWLENLWEYRFASGQRKATLCYSSFIKLIILSYTRTHSRQCCLLTFLKQCDVRILMIVKCFFKLATMSLDVVILKVAPVKCSAIIGIITCFGCSSDAKLNGKLLNRWCFLGICKRKTSTEGGGGNASCESVSFFDRLSFWKSLNDRHYPLQLINEKDKKCNRIQLKVVIFYFFLITIHIIVDSLNPYFAFLLSSHTFLKDIQW